MCGCLPQHLCGGQSRSCRSLFSPSTAWELRTDFRLSHPPTLKHLANPSMFDFYLKGHAVTVGTCLQNTVANEIHCEYGVFEALLLPSSPPVL